MLEFRILGPLEIWRGSEQVVVGGPRQQSALAMLLLETDRIVPLERLIEAVWHNDPPATARAQIQICISGLRRVLGEGESGPRIDTVRPGYVLKPEGMTVDLWKFESQVAVARRELGGGNFTQAARTFRSALELWRGAALIDVDSPLVQRAVVHLNERRLIVLEECLETELAAGKVQDVLRELLELTHEHPLRERGKILLMKALYRAGRRAEALDVYRTARADMIDQLGIEPCDDLQKLHQAILEGAPEPASAQPATPSNPISNSYARPQLLPATIADFTGRSAIVTSVLSAAVPIDDSVDSGYTVPVNLIFGPGGAGKTALAIHTAHRLVERFPDGQLYAKLRAGGEEVSSADILKRFLRVLGVQDSELPQGVDERAEIYRDLISRRRVLIVLDDAMSEAQVAPLLPGSSTNSVLITSRRRLATLPVANRYELKAMNHDDAVDLLANILGIERVAAQPDAIDTLCELCGYLPLNLRVVSARLASRPRWAVADMVDRMLHESERLDELSRDEIGLRASISISYHDLSADAQRLLRRLALLDAPNYASWIGSPLLQTDLRRAIDIMDELVEAYLIDAEEESFAEPIRYRFHDMVRQFARELLLDEESPEERKNALQRLVEALQFLATEAHRREYSGEYLLPRCEANLWRLPPDCTNQILADPLTWLEQERLSIVAGVEQAAMSNLAEQSWNLALCAVTLFKARSYFPEWHETHEVALEAARQAGDQRGVAVMRYSLGLLHLCEQKDETAAEHLEAALEIFTQLGDRQGSALAQCNIAVVDRRAGRMDRAIEHGRTALGILQESGDRTAEAHSLLSLSQSLLSYGDDGAACELLEEALEICEEVDNWRVHAQALSHVGDLCLRLGRFEEAAEAFDSMLKIVRDMFDEVGECYALIGLAGVYICCGHPDSAITILREASATAKAIGHSALEKQVLLTQVEAELASGCPGHADQTVAPLRPHWNPAAGRPGFDAQRQDLPGSKKGRSSEAGFRDRVHISPRHRFALSGMLPGLLDDARSPDAAASRIT
ncbi:MULTISPECIES: BTAD domain-containing putative transcriptional regulator [unclassified Streptomyces]|uniref:AfsR/SARP family transcriptional regulator n=1 Tax=unclassified Streptomyces TaxID=2593676 RepID=UPI00382AA7A1